MLWRQTKALLVKNWRIKLRNRRRLITEVSASFTSPCRISCLLD
jgi:hypothetical protein